MQTKYQRRLRKLANFLEKLPPEKFNFATMLQTECGSATCAIGWCHYAFPKLVGIIKYSDGSTAPSFPHRHGDTWNTTDDQAGFFGISRAELEETFYSSRVYELGAFHNSMVRREQVIARLRLLAKRASHDN